MQRAGAAAGGTGDGGRRRSLRRRRYGRGGRVGDRRSSSVGLSQNGGRREEVDGAGRGGGGRSSGNRRANDSEGNSSGRGGVTVGDFRLSVGNGVVVSATAVGSGGNHAPYSATATPREVGSGGGGRSGSEGRTGQNDNPRGGRRRRSGGGSARRNESGRLGNANQHRRRSHGRGRDGAAGGRTIPRRQLDPLHSNLLEPNSDHEGMDIAFEQVRAALLSNIFEHFGTGGDGGAEGFGGRLIGGLSEGGGGWRMGERIGGGIFGDFFFEDETGHDARKKNELMCPTCMKVHYPVEDSRRIKIPEEERNGAASGGDEANGDAEGSRASYSGAAVVAATDQSRATHGFGNRGGMSGRQSDSSRRDALTPFRLELSRGEMGEDSDSEVGSNSLDSLPQLMSLYLPNGPSQMNGSGGCVENYAAGWNSSAVVAVSTAGERNQSQSRRGYGGNVDPTSMLSSSVFSPSISFRIESSAINERESGNVTDLASLASNGPAVETPTLSEIEVDGEVRPNDNYDDESSVPSLLGEQIALMQFLEADAIFDGRNGSANDASANTVFATTSSTTNSRSAIEPPPCNQNASNIRNVDSVSDESTHVTGVRSSESSSLSSYSQMPPLEDLGNSRHCSGARTRESARVDNSNRSENPSRVFVTVCVSQNALVDEYSSNPSALLELLDDRDDESFSSHDISLHRMLPRNLQEDSSNGDHNNDTTTNSLPDFFRRTTMRSRESSIDRADESSVPTNPLTHLRDYGGLRVFATASCPICLEEHNPIVALKCGHPICEIDYRNLGGYLAIDENNTSAARSDDPLTSQSLTSSRNQRGQTTHPGRVMSSRDREIPENGNGVTRAGLEPYQLDSLQRLFEGEINERAVTPTTDGQHPHRRNDGQSINRRNTATPLGDSAEPSTPASVPGEHPAMTRGSRNQNRRGTSDEVASIGLRRRRHRGGQRGRSWALVNVGSKVVPQTRQDRGIRYPCCSNDDCTLSTHHVQLWSVRSNGYSYECCYPESTECYPDGMGGLWIVRPKDADTWDLLHKNRQREIVRFQVHPRCQVVADGSGCAWALSPPSADDDHSGWSMIYYSPRTGGYKIVASVPESSIIFPGRHGKAWVMVNNDHVSGDCSNSIKLLSAGLWVISSHSDKKIHNWKSGDGSLHQRELPVADSDGEGNLWMLDNEENGHHCTILKHFFANNCCDTAPFQFTLDSKLYGCDSEDSVFVHGRAVGSETTTPNTKLFHVFKDTQTMVWHKKTLIDCPFDSTIASNGNGGVWIMMKQPYSDSMCFFHADVTGCRLVHSDLIFPQSELISG